MAKKTTKTTKSAASKAAASKTPNNKKSATKTAQNNAKAKTPTTRAAPREDIIIPADRDTLKPFFITGAYPTQKQFHALIDSNLNMADHGISLADPAAKANLNFAGEIRSDWYVKSGKKLTVESEGADITGPVQTIGEHGTLTTSQRLTVQEGGLEVANGGMDVTGKSYLRGALELEQNKIIYGAGDLFIYLKIENTSEGPFVANAHLNIEREIYDNYYLFICQYYAKAIHTTNGTRKVPSVEVSWGAPGFSGDDFPFDNRLSYHVENVGNEFHYTVYINIVGIRRDLPNLHTIDLGNM